MHCASVITHQSVTYKRRCLFSQLDDWWFLSTSIMCLLTAHSYFANDGSRLESANLRSKYEHNRWTLIRVIDALADQVAKNIRSFSYFAIPNQNRFYRAHNQSDFSWNFPTEKHWGNELMELVRSLSSGM